MSNYLPGNSYFDRAVLAGADEATTGAEFGQIQATLALAYEQRTANLIAWADGSSDDEALRDLWQQIAARLGLKEEA